LPTLPTFRKKNVLPAFACRAGNGRGAEIMARKFSFDIPPNASPLYPALVVVPLEMEEAVALLLIAAGIDVVLPIEGSAVDAAASLAPAAAVLVVSGLSVSVPYC
jgi:hypothetical protein